MPSREERQPRSGRGESTAASREGGSPPAGWFASQHGGERYWDGSDWTNRWRDDSRRGKPPEGASGLRGLFPSKRRIEPPATLPDRSDLSEAFKQLHPDDQQRLLTDRRLRNTFLTALDSEQLRDARILAVIHCFMNANVSDEGPLVLTSDRLFWFPPPPLGGSINAQLKEIWDVQEGDGVLVASFGLRNRIFANFGLAEVASQSFFRNQFMAALKASQGGEGSGDSEADALEKFAKLRDQGVLSEEEFQAKKAQILRL